MKKTNSLSCSRPDREKTEGASRVQQNWEKVTNENKTARACDITSQSMLQMWPKLHQKQTQAVRHADKLMDGKGDIFCFKCDLQFVPSPPQVQMVTSTS